MADKNEQAINIPITADASSAIGVIQQLARAIQKLEEQQTRNVRRNNMLTAAVNQGDAIVKNEELVQKRIEKLREDADKTENAREKARLKTEAATLVGDTTTRLAKGVAEIKRNLGADTKTLEPSMRKALGLTDTDLDAATKGVDKLRDTLGKAKGLLTGTAARPAPLAAAIGQTGTRLESLKNLKGALESAGDLERFTPDLIKKMIQGGSQFSSNTAAERASIEADFQKLGEAARAPITGAETPKDLEDKANAIKRLKAVEESFVEDQIAAGKKATSGAVEAQKAAATKRKEIDDIVKEEAKAVDEKVTAAKKTAAAETKVAEKQKQVAAESESTEKASAEVAEATKKTTTSKKKTAESAKTESKAAEETQQATTEVAASSKKTSSTRRKTAAVATEEAKAAQSDQVAATESAKATRQKAETAKKTADVKQVEAAAEAQAVENIKKRVAAAEAQKKAAAAPAPTKPAPAPTPAQQYGPSRAVLEAAAKPAASASGALDKTASAANKAAASLDKVASSANAAAGGGGTAPSRVARGGGGALMPQLLRELKDPALAQASSNVHKLFRQVEAANNPKYQQGFTQISHSLFSIGGAAGGASNAIRRLSDSNSGLLGQIKNVVGMAASYQVLQGIATEVGQLIGHLSGGIIDFNSMIEKTTVGFTTLFRNQARASFALAEDTGKVNTEMADLSGELDYVKLGYTSVESAASGMIENIRQFANVTPFRFEELADATLRMRAFGFSLDEVLSKADGTATGFKGAVQTVGDAVAALGGGAPEFRRITYALGQMKQAGRVYQNDMMQLANAGIGGYKYIANALMDQISTTNSEGKKVAKQGYEQMYAELQKNAIETIRRLTTAGRISGEVASRAILQGMEQDFGGGMAAYSKTFFGALSTVADSSQSLVAEAFKPLYDSIRDTTVALAESLQTADAVKFAQDFAKYVKVAVDVLTRVGERVFKISRLIFEDVVGAFRSLNNETRQLGSIGGTQFQLLAKGFGVVASLMENDVVRSLVLATIATKALSAAVAANPLLSFITLVIMALGAFKIAYEQNFMGFRQFLDSVAKKWGPMIQVIEDKIIPLLDKISSIVLGTLLASFVTFFELIEPTLQGITDIIGALINQFEFLGTVLGVAGSAFILGFAGMVVISGLVKLRNAIANIAFALSGVTLEAAAAKGMLDKVTLSAMSANGGMLPGGQKPGFVAMGGNSGMKMMGGAMLGQMALGAVTPALTANGTNEVTTAMTELANSILSAVMFAGMLKMVLGVGLGELAVNALARLVISLGLVQAGATQAAVAGTIMQLAFTAWPLLAVAAIAGIAVALNDFLNSQQAKEFKNYMDALAAQAKELGATDINGKPVDVPTFTDEESKIANLIRKKTVWGKDPFEGQGFLGTEWLSNSKDEAGNVKQIWIDVYAKLGKIKKAQEDIKNFKIGNWGSEWKANTEKVKNNTQSIYDLTGLLIEGNKQVADGQERLNFLLDLAKLKYKGALDLLQELATSILNKILNPDVRINPYTGLEQVGLELKDILDIQQEMSFAQFENASGTVRSFDEYRSILQSILPLSEKDYELKEDGTRTDKISLKAVTERLKIEKQRRKEIELIRKAAQAEYDLSIEVLKQYDESIDPLERAVSLRKAQLKYVEDIRDLDFQALENVVDQAKVSYAWDQVTAKTKIKLRELQKGQELILNEMRRMFEQYQQDIDNILNDPRLSAADKEDKATKRLKKLMSDLETQFGITEAMLTEEIQYFNKQIDDFIATLDLNDHNLNVSWGGKWAAQLEAKGFGVLKKYLNDTLKEIIRLMALITAATEASTATEGDIVLKNRKYYLAVFKEKLSWLQSRGLMNDVWRHLFSDINIGFAREMDPSRLLELRNKISTFLTQLERFASFPEPWLAAPRYFSQRASGGMVAGGTPYIVGERGPELLVPRTSGLVLNNSVSARLMSMLSGRGGGGTNVIVNVNNPTIRSDQDIRKLADQITRAQVSAFRTAGGRLS